MATPAPLWRAVITVLSGMVLFALLLSILPFGYSAAYAGQIYPGVAVAGIELTGLTQEEATKLLAQELDYPQRGKIALQEGANVRVLSPAELGLFLDAQTSALAAYNFGRTGGVLKSLLDRWQAWDKGETCIRCSSWMSAWRRIF
jgi:hypothetical protein